MPAELSVHGIGCCDAGHNTRRDPRARNSLTRQGFRGVSCNYRCTLPQRLTLHPSSESIPVLHEERSASGDKPHSSPFGGRPFWNGHSRCGPARDHRECQCTRSPRGHQQALETQRTRQGTVAAWEPKVESARGLLSDARERILRCWAGAFCLRGRVDLAARSRKPRARQGLDARTMEVEPTLLSCYVDPNAAI
jgi:hypothetical protein